MAKRVKYMATIYRADTCEIIDTIPVKIDCDHDDGFTPEESLLMARFTAVQEIRENYPDLAEVELQVEIIQKT